MGFLWSFWVTLIILAIFHFGGPHFGLELRVHEEDAGQVDLEFEVGGRHAVSILACYSYHQPEC